MPWYVRRHGWGPREWFLLAWTVPPVLVYTLVHFGQAGYVLTFLPALVILLSRVLLAALARAAERVPRARGCAPRWPPPSSRSIVLANGAFFVSARPLARDFDTPQAGLAAGGRRTRRSTGSSAARPPRCASTRR